ncbi:MAG: CNP1-like family protein [Rhodocyclaceae bacterium]|nr:CNP1-like family protein [Rhodocyclaceae bacterium]
MKPRAGTIGLLLSSLLLAGISAHAQQEYMLGSKRDFREYPPAAVPGDPSQVALPPYPKPGNLVEHDIGPAAWNRAYVDASAISVGEDRVVRYVLVLKTPGGVSNVSFEGLRCSEGDRLAYAYGRDDGTWVRSTRPEWRPIPSSGAQGHYRELAKDLFCEAGQPAGTAAELTARLKKSAPRGRP